ncbi:MAG TPA: hybrid sensor histidine kinase/response regulator, partial [Thermoanaerobaculia bacterium]|nr:hybrid sensor histidine kinase/response regulator [Thermoanaerobaculia bacterium]
MHDGSRLEERVLILAPGGRDAALAYSVLENAGFVCSVCASAEDLAVAIAEGAGLVLVAEEALGGSASTVVVDVLLRQPAWS